jgi:hypothetical protein
MVEETILQHWVLTRFAFPFLLLFFIVFALLQKTKVLGGKKQIDAMTAFVIGLIFVSVAYPKMVVGNLILFLTVALVVLFVMLLLWGFLVGGESNMDIFKTNGAKWASFAVVLVAVVIATLWATGVEWAAWNFLFESSWSQTFWVNVIFIALVAVALSVAWKSGGGK